ncbi:hypothetical protein [Streptomyces sp. NRRL B-24484]|uniref:hypothetical protein n=1 Tax=Streptomyces sp. NRRL B-24484 TaxID=1463833 RepID=UPI0004C1645C|nr:hypothetical protein [Streptomyces sp. NRRL B-24484]
MTKEEFLYDIERRMIGKTPATAAPYPALVADPAFELMDTAEKGAVGEEAFVTYTLSAFPCTA